MKHSTLGRGSQDWKGFRCFYVKGKQDVLNQLDSDLDLARTVTTPRKHFL